MPRELVGLIYGYIDMETRLPLLLHNSNENILQYIPHMPTDLLIQMWKRNVHDKIFTDDDCNSLCCTFDNLLPSTKYLYNNTEHSIKHPIYETLNNDVKLNRYRVNYGSDFGRRWYMRTKIDTFISYIPTIYTFHDKFDYRIRKVLFRFIQLLMKPIRRIKTARAAANFARAERLHRFRFKRKIFPKLFTAVRKHERKRVAQIKLDEKAKKAELKRIKLAEKEEIKRTKLAQKQIKLAQKQIKLAQKLENAEQNKWTETYQT
tara:strand:- start:2649 stop:3434 length:786 start_codon:yes stop_codon:yes gene_type:complete